MCKVHVRGLPHGKLITMTRLKTHSCVELITLNNDHVICDPMVIEI